ncbi:MAG: hypothetical protein F6K65_05810 [Moorea sp. SIO3C2]|nr:hypothetical protein [Moorena sp. SIO3C2]
MIKASLSYGNYRQRRRLAVGHAKGEREQTMTALQWFPPLAIASRKQVSIGLIYVTSADH